MQTKNISAFPQDTVELGERLAAVRNSAYRRSVTPQNQQDYLNDMYEACVQDMDDWHDAPSRHTPEWTAYIRAHPNRFNLTGCLKKNNGKLKW